MDSVEKTRLAIVHGDRDLIRIIPSIKGDVVDLKVSSVGMSFDIEFVSPMEISTGILTPESELSYHSSKKTEGNLNPARFHIKTVAKSVSSYSFIQRGIVDLDRQSEFPIPLASIDIPKPFGPRYRKKPSHRRFDIAGEYGILANSVEIYFAGEDFDPDNWPKKWPNISCLFLMAPIDFLIDGADVREDIVEQFSKRNPMMLIEMHKIENFFLICKPCLRSGLSDNRIRFYENIEYIDILGNTPVVLTDDDGVPISDAAPAYVRDLNHQRALGLPITDIRTWELLFNTAAIDAQDPRLSKRIIAITQTVIENL